MLSPYIYRAFASTFQSFADNLSRLNNDSSRADLNHTSSSHRLKNGRDPRESSSIDRLTGCSSFIEPMNSHDLYDCYEPKVEAWRSALYLARLIFCTDMEIVTGVTSCKPGSGVTERSGTDPRGCQTRII